MKKLLSPALAAAAFGLTAALAAPALAQAAPGARPAPAGGPRTGRMQNVAAYLGLTGAQKAQMKPIILGAGRQARAIQMNSSLTPQAKQAKLLDLGRSASQRMMAILTPDQRRKLTAMRQQQRAGKGGKF